MIKLPAVYYDGQTSNPRTVELSFDDSGQVHISGPAVNNSYNLATLKSKPRVGKLPAQFIFPDGTLCEVSDQPGLAAALRLLPKRSFQDVIHRIENNLAAILASLILAVAVLFIVIQYGIPFGARQVAYRIPVELENRMGKDALAFFDKAICKPSELTLDKKRHIEKIFSDALLKMDTPPIQLHFRNCGKMGANAFALPSGIIIFTDEMVRMARDDRELIGVLAHEVGHVQHRHIMRQILQNSVTALLLVLLTGDIGSASSFAAALPTLLVRAKFSRDFEVESDNYASRYLKSQAISPSHLARLLERLAKQDGNSESRITGFLSSHPLTEERIKNLEN